MGTWNKVGNPISACSCSCITAPCASNPITVCPSYTGCQSIPHSRDLSGATFTLFDSTGAIVGTSISNASGVGACIPSFSPLLAGSKVRLTGFPCFFTAPADIPVGSSTCGALLTANFGTLAFNTTSRTCCCMDRCTDLPASVSATVNGHSLSLTRVNASRWSGCFMMPVSTIASYPAFPACFPISSASGSTNVYVDVGLVNCIPFASISIPFDSNAKRLLPNSCTGTAALPGDAGPAVGPGGNNGGVSPPDCFGPGQPASWIYVSYGNPAGGVSMTCDPVTGSGSWVAGTAPGGSSPFGDALYQVFGTTGLSVSWAE